MLNFGNKEFRNLQEQVLKNMNDIQDMQEGVNILANFGIKVIGQVDNAEDLPDPATYEGDYAGLVDGDKCEFYIRFTNKIDYTRTIKSYKYTVGGNK